MRGLHGMSLIESALTLSAQGSTQKCGDVAHIALSPPPAGDSRGPSHWIMHHQHDEGPGLRSHPWCLRFLRCGGRHGSVISEHAGEAQENDKVGSVSAPYLRVPISTSLQDKAKVRELGWQTYVLQQRLCSEFTGMQLVRGDERGPEE
jgi:hypothetical protein